MTDENEPASERERIADRLARLREVQAQGRNLGSYGFVRETVYRRYLGEISTQEMLDIFKSRDYTFMLPRHATIADTDGPSGSWHDLTTAVYDKLLTREEYSEIQNAVTITDPRPADEDSAQPTDTISRKENPMPAEQTPNSSVLEEKLPSLPENRFWRVSEVTQSTPLSISSLRNAKEALIGLVPKVNPYQLRLELREPIKSEILRTLNGNKETSRLLESRVVDITNLEENQIVDTLASYANILLHERNTENRDRLRTTLFTGDYRR